jgi:hypothetical protein
VRVIGPRAGVRVGVGTGEAGAGWAGIGVGSGAEGAGGAGSGIGAGAAGAWVGGTGGGVADSPIRTSAGGAWPGSELPLRAWVMPRTAKMTATAALTRSASRGGDGMAYTLPLPTGPEMRLK